MKVLITGITGLIGSHLADFLLEKDSIELVGLKRFRSDAENINRLLGRVEIVEGDIEDLSSTRYVIEKVRPQIIFHMAAQSYPKESWNAPFTTMHANIDGTINILETVRNFDPSTKVLIACSSAEYGFIKENEGPIRENRILKPLSPYGISKVAQELLGYEYFENFKIQTFLPRYFNQVGPGQGERTSLQTFCHQVAMIEKGKQEPKIYVGNLLPKRDFLDVRDGVKATWAIVEKGKPATPYNICSGVAPTIKEVLDLVLSLANVKPEIVIEKSRLRPTDEPILLGDNSRLKKDTGWQSNIPLKETVENVLNWWRDHL